MALPHLKNAHTGAAAGAQMGGVNHARAQGAAFGAARRLQMARALGGHTGMKPMTAGPGLNPSAAAGAQLQMPHPAAPQNDFRHAVGARVGGASLPEIHGAIDALTAAKQFTPLQGAALKAHQGPLVGPQGQQTIGKIAGAITHRRAAAAQVGPMGQPAPVAVQPPSPRGAPPMISGGGMPAGLRQP